MISNNSKFRKCMSNLPMNMYRDLLVTRLRIRVASSLRRSDKKQQIETQKRKLNYKQQSLYSLAVCFALSCPLVNYKFSAMVFSDLRFATIPK